MHNKTLMNTFKAIACILAVISSSTDAGLLEFIDNIPDESTSALTAWDDEIKAPFCSIRNCVDPIAFRFECQCSVVAEAFKAIPDSVAAAQLIGLSREFVDDTLKCCTVGTSNMEFLKCMIGCNDKVRDNPLCMLASCKIPKEVVLPTDVKDVAEQCCPNGEPIETFDTCFNEMVDVGLIDKEKWTHADSVNTDQIDA